MSEGPEVKRAAARLNDALAGETIRNIDAHHKNIISWLETEPRALLGRKILRVRAIGKHILFDLDNGSHLHNHLLMFGSWRIYGPRAKIETDKPIMEVIQTEKHRAVLRGGSVMELLPAGTLEKHPRMSKLGPDVLGEPFDQKRALENLARHPEMEIGVALLDQEIMAGIGNYLKSEILFLARINPHSLISELSDKPLREIIRISREVTLFSFENASYTIAPEIRGRSRSPRRARHVTVYCWAQALCIPPHKQSMLGLRYPYSPVPPGSRQGTHHVLLPELPSRIDY